MLLETTNTTCISVMYLIRKVTRHKLIRDVYNWSEFLTEVRSVFTHDDETTPISECEDGSGINRCGLKSPLLAKLTVEDHLCCLCVKVAKWEIGVSEW